MSERDLIERLHLLEDRLAQIERRDHNPKTSVRVTTPADARLLTGLAITSGARALTGTGFTPADVGKNIIVHAAGASGNELFSTVAAFVSATELTLSDDAGTTVASAGTGAIGTDCEAGIEAVINSVTGGVRVSFEQGGFYLLKNLAAIINIGKSNVILEGNGATIYKPANDTTADTAASPFIYVAGSSDADNYNYIHHVVIRNLNFQNVGQTQNNTAGTDTGTWTTLNGAATDYNRLQNKRLNCNPAVVYLYARDGLVENCQFYRTGSSVAAYSATDSVHVINNRIRDWGCVGCYPGPNSIVQGNYFDQNAPIIKDSDRSSDLGTSHAIYVTSSFDRVRILNNTIINARVCGVQFNTATTTPFVGCVVQNNYFERCFFSTYVQTPTTSTAVSHIVYRGNTFMNCGPCSISTNSLKYLEFTENIFDGLADHVTSYFTWVLPVSCSVGDWMISNNKFRNIPTAGDTAIRILVDSADHILTIKDNTFEATCSYGIRIISNTADARIIIENNRFYCTCRIEDQPASAVGVTNTLFTKNKFFGETVSGIQLLVSINGAKIIDNEFYVSTANNYAFYATPAATGTGDTFLVDNKFFGPNNTAYVRFNNLSSVYLIGNSYEAGATRHATMGTALTRCHNELEIALTTAPSAPAAGDLVHADGTSWDPGTGVGIYAYIGGAWAEL